MEIKGKRILVLGGWGQVGSAICREFMEERPAQIIVSSRWEWQTKEALAQLEVEFPGGATDLAGEWGDVLARYEHKDSDRRELLDDEAARRGLLADLFDELKSELLRQTFLYRVIMRYRPHIIVDCINLATIVAYQDVYRSTRHVLRTFDERPAEAREAVERHLAASYVPQLIRHVQVLFNSMLEGGTRFYVKIGTSGTGGMGLNIPYTHSEEKPSRVLLSKSALAGAHTLLLFLMARTPGAPIIKEVKPTAAIAWKQIGYGPVLKGGRPVALEQVEMADAVELGERFSSAAPAALEKALAARPTKTLESVFIDTGENGVFSRGEFEAITAVDQMEYVTPEEIARNVIFEIKGGNTGHDVINALDQASMGPTYRAGALRESALAAMRRLEDEHRVDSIAFENLGPPKLSKVLFEAYLLKRAFGTLQAAADASPSVLQERVCQVVSSDADLRARIVSIGIPILLAEGNRLLRGRSVKVPTDDAELTVSPERIELWAEDGWVDLRLRNFERWHARFHEILREMSSIPPNDSSSRYERNHNYWFRDPAIQPGKIASWLFIREEKGSRMKN
ncbi:MAG: short-chain dehydrogenase [Candidatus Wallbacteria bacterium]|nr:short-chain dehydrogenase [Candidatus Wallbacteria bacterium]MBI4866088.1 short-chain dehydrogenase [Candidatus Wallbacteria bacterium]